MTRQPTPNASLFIDHGMRLLLMEDATQMHAACARLTAAAVTMPLNMVQYVMALRDIYAAQCMWNALLHSESWRLRVYPAFTLQPAPTRRAKVPLNL